MRNLANIVRGGRVQLCVSAGAGRYIKGIKEKKKHGTGDKHAISKIILPSISGH